MDRFVAPRPRFRDRHDAGRQLGERLAAVADEAPVVLGLTRGGVPVACEVARALGAPLDFLVVRKLGVPWHRELAFGALGEDGARYLNSTLVARLGVTPDAITDVASREADELARRVARYRRVRPEIDVAGRTVVVVDDGLATGASAKVACEVARARGARRVLVAVPVAAREAREELASYADEVVSLLVPTDFSAVGEFYEDFAQTDDQEVVDLLVEEAHRDDDGDGDGDGDGDRG